MKYLCLIYDDEKKWATMSKAEAEAYMGEYFAFTDSIKASGHYIAGHLAAVHHVADVLRGDAHGQVGATVLVVVEHGQRPAEGVAGLGTAGHQTEVLVNHRGLASAAVDDAHQTGAGLAVHRGRRVADRVRLLVVPGSEDVKRQAEAEGLDEVVRAAGGEWREPGCSMCIGMNGDTVPSGKLSVSTSNRNFEGRQGSGARTVLASPLTAAAAAVTGAIADPRDLVS